MSLPETTQGTFALRTLTFLLCIPSGGVLLAHIYGLLPMHIGGAFIALPCCLLLAAIWFWGRDEVAEAIAVGFFAGLVGTILYDIARVPVLMAGRRVFGPIELYGVWLWNAPISSRFTEVTGWIYHFSNGITFGIMYALVMRGRHWLWAIAWAFVLETIFVLSPLAHSVALFADSMAIVVAYYGHVAYGIGLGLPVQRWSYTTGQLDALEPIHKWVLAILPLAACVGYLWSFGPVERDARARAGVLRVEGSRLNPDWVRITAGESLGIENPGGTDVTIRMPQTKAVLAVPAGQTTTHVFPRPAGKFDIYQIQVVAEGRSRSSFAVVEPEGEK